MSSIRLARREDAAAVSAVVDAAYVGYVPRLGRKPTPMLDDYLDLISKGIVHVLEEKGEIAGVLVLIPEERAMLLRNIAVRPDAQGRGIGRRLLTFAEAKTLEAGYDVIQLYTNEVMIENLAIYKHCGYVETHRVEENRIRRVYMAKRLTS
jgi:GNAT superfamily N-acetyltransferase